MTIGPLDLAIRYDPALGFGDAALALIPVADGDFTLFLNGVLLVSHRDDGREPKVADVRAVLAATAADPQ